MASEIPDPDPNGDVLLVLRNPNAAFAVWDENEPLLSNATPCSIPASVEEELEL